ncbi:MAG: Ferrous iron transport protein [Pseudomonadota bacterium]|jgi:ferrous iron transport protein B
MMRVALLGMPNSGKSTLFNRLTGAHARVGNWPGITVELLAARLLVGDQMVQLVDLPGIYDLRGLSEDEHVVTNFLEGHRPNLLIVVLNATQLDRQARLLQQLIPLGIPLLAVLNMSDEAKKLGMQIDVEGMQASLGFPVCLLSAKHGDGTSTLTALMRKQLQAAKNKNLILVDAMSVDAMGVDAVDVDAIVNRHIAVPMQASHQLTERLDRLFLHPWLGLPALLAMMLLLFEAVFALGKPLQEIMAWLFSTLRTALLEPVLAPLPSMLNGFLLDGVYNGFGTVASFVPLIVLFFLFVGIVEDSGYLSRAAFLMDGLMARLGLDGRSFVMMLMGFGCNVPALMGTRVIRSRGLRLLTMLTIPFSLCSARLQVFVFFTAALFSPWQAPLVLFTLYLISILLAMLTALAFKGRYINSEPFIIEMPPYRFPTTKQIVLRAWLEIRHFLIRVTRFIVLGVVMVWVLTNFPSGAVPGSSSTWAGMIGQWLDPILSPVGIDPNLTIALVFGFVAKEIVIGALAVIYGQEGDLLSNMITQQITWAQAYSFMLFTLIYTPCLSTVATIRAESKSLAFTALTIVWPLLLAWSVSFVFYQVALLATA